MDATFTGDGGGDPIAQFHLVIREAAPTRADLLFGGSLLIAGIRDRTVAGVDVDGSPFAPYSEDYAKRKSGALGHGRVDLFGADHHTHMLNALQTVVDGDDSFGVGIYANDELEERARVHNEGLTIRTRLGSGRHKPKKEGKASFDMPQRRWLDANMSEVQSVNQAIGERIDDRLRLLLQ
ncbi:MAG TPA: phage virion morphogenesis protein [Bryobacteraceae bacterium]|jgi:hypothetical protein|nr:phage virion morphogenesis protein [Bryobacteraceae bacterium]